MRVSRLYILLLFVCSSLSTWATDINGAERYYQPLDKLASNPALLFRNKEAPTSAVSQFPFSANEYGSRMAKIPGSTWNAQTSAHLNRLTGVYADRMNDALGIYAELHVKISDIFKKNQVPEQYQLLAPMLSGMNLHYVSGAKRGVWQLDMITGIRYGLVINDMRDDRDDPVLSAAAAAAYIKDLQMQFRSPEAVLWAYVGSPAEVKRAFARAESSEPQKVVSYLPDYLRQAVPVFSAWNFIWAYTEKDNLPVFMPAVFLPSEKAITADRTHLGQIAEMLEIPLSSLKELNPALKKHIAGEKETIHLPQGYASRFLSKAADIAKYRDSLYFRTIAARQVMAGSGTSYKPSSAGTTTTVKKYHKVKPGETLSQLAQKYHVSVSSLKKWNNLTSNGIVAGQKIIVQQSVQVQMTENEDWSIRENVQIVDTTPDDQSLASVSSALPTSSKEENTVRPTLPKPKTAWIYYTVKSGDTLSSIGRKYGVSYTKIKEWNGLRSDKLSVGQKLKIKK